MKKQKFHQPPVLKLEDKVAIISPSSGMPFVFPWVYEQGLNRIREVFHLQPVEFPSARQSPDFLSENPRARADDINAAFADPSIKAIIASTGGNDQFRILPFLDKEIIEKNPKIFMGYSDNTNLHLFLWNLGIISYYGGSVMTQFAMGRGMQEYTVNSIKKVFFGVREGEVFPAQEYTDADLDWADRQNLDKTRSMYPGNGWIWHQPNSETLQGSLWGGCLEVLDFHLSIRAYLPSPQQLEGAIFFVETSEEMPTDGFVYRFFAALGEIGYLQKFKAILVGIPKARFCDRIHHDGRESYIENQQNAVKKALQDYSINIPVIFNMNFGHTDPQMLIPNGGIVSIDGQKRTVKFIAEG